MLFRNYWLLPVLAVALCLDTEFISSFNAAKTLKPITILHFDRFADIPLHTYKEKNIAIILDKDKSTILHASSLNTAARALDGNGPRPFQFQLYSNKNSIDVENPKYSNSWFEFKTKALKTAAGDRKPITGCLNTEMGEGGTITGGFSKTFGKTSAFDLGYGYTFSFNITAGVGTTLTIDSAVSLSSTFSCAVPSNSTGQLFIQPTYLDYIEPTYRSLSVEFGWPWYNPFVSVPQKVLLGDWTSSANFQTVNFKSKPVVTCVVDPRYLRCDEEVFGDSWVLGAT